MSVELTVIQASDVKLSQERYITTPPIIIKQTDIKDIINVNDGAIIRTLNENFNTLCFFNIIVNPFYIF